MYLSWEFAHPWYLLLAGLIPILVRLLWRRAGVVAFAATPLAQDLPRTLRLALRNAPNYLLLASFLCLLLAVARPRSPHAPTRVEQDGIAIMMVVDRSPSMEARDLVPNDLSIDRLTVVKHVFRDFVLGKDGGAGRPEDVIGLVGFAGFADSLCPLTLDHTNLVAMVDDLQIAQDDESGTAVGDAVALAVSRLKMSKAKSRIAILLTDGVSNRGAIKPLQAADLAVETGVKLYCVGAGTNGLAAFPAVDAYGRRTLVRARAEIDETTLKEIAKRTGGQYFRATDAETLASIYSQIDLLERSHVEAEQYLRYQEHFAPFAGVGLALLMASMISGATLLRVYP